MSDFGKKSYQKKEVLNIDSELLCSGLAHFEEWHYSAYGSSGSCSLGLITKDALPASSGDNQKININLNILSDFQSETFVTRTSNLYNPFIYI